VNKLATDYIVFLDIKKKLYNAAASEYFSLVKNNLPLTRKNNFIYLRWCMWCQTYLLPLQ